MGMGSNTTRTQHAFRRIEEGQLLPLPLEKCAVSENPSSFENPL